MNTYGTKLLAVGRSSGRHGSFFSQTRHARAPFLVVDKKSRHSRQCNIKDACKRAKCGKATEGRHHAIQRFECVRVISSTSSRRSHRGSQRISKFQVPSFKSRHYFHRRQQTMQIYVPDITEPSKPNPGLVAIMNARAREEALSSMMKHVRDQAGMMNRIRWEERTEKNVAAGADGIPRCARPNQREGRGVRDSLTEGTAQLETRFVRCALSEIVDEIRSEDSQRKQLMEQRREGAKTRRREAERQAQATRIEEDAKRAARRRSYTVRSMDKLGNAVENDDRTVSGRRSAPAPAQRASLESSNAQHYLALATAKLSLSSTDGRHTL